MKKTITKKEILIKLRERWKEYRQIHEYQLNKGDMNTARHYQDLYIEVWNIAEILLETTSDVAYNLLTERNDLQ